MITYQVESWDQYYGDPAREGLWREHYDEFLPAHESKMEMGPDVAAYSAMANAGMLSIVTARKSGVMVGYCLVLVKRHLHYSALCGFEDSYFLSKPERQGYAGYRLISRSLSELRRRGVVRVYWMTKEFNSIETLLERMGMTRIDSVYAMWLGEG